jgi:hypothetical protein
LFPDIKQYEPGIILNFNTKQRVHETLQLFRKLSREIA